MSRAREMRALAVLFVGVLIAALDIAIVGPALPAIRDGFSVGARWLPTVFSVYVLFYLIGTPLLGKRA
ncbi:MAG TPA: MFS transporter, partial [Gammaproteobacteria bacterium]|nr:MFS transporter [Gammaproteobacteria bacterium]